MISPEKWKILTPLRKVPKNVGDLAKLNVAQSAKIAQSGHNGSTVHRWVARCQLKNGTIAGREPWSSGYGRRLVFKMSWVQIPAWDSGWTFFILICCQNCIVCLNKPNVNEKEAGYGKCLIRMWTLARFLLNYLKLFCSRVSVRPDLAKFSHFGKYLMYLDGNILRVYLVFGKIPNLLLHRKWANFH